MRTISHYCLRMLDEVASVLLYDLRWILSGIETSAAHSFNHCAVPRPSSCADSGDDMMTTLTLESTTLPRSAANCADGGYVKCYAHTRQLLAGTSRSTVDTNIQTAVTYARAAQDN